MQKLLALSALLLLAAAGTVRAQSKPAAPATPPAAAKPAAPAPGKPESLHDRAAYIIGFNLGRSLQQQDVDVNPDLIIKGIRDAISGSPSLLSEEETQTAMNGFQQEMSTRHAEKTKALGEKNKKEGEAFLAANKAKSGVTTTASGLQYEVIQDGNGPKPKIGDEVSVNYRGTLLDGTVFDSSYDRGQPVTFGVGDVIPGWVEALQLMKTGSKWKIYLPAALAYGEAGAGNAIGPNQTLVFEVELLSAKPKAAAQDQATPPAQGDAKPHSDAKPPGGR
jgi:FKBP-type peptidyl-prolyl cis-trans isomerase FklB